MNKASTLQILYARQPIVGPSLELAGFELLFRDNDRRNAAPSQFDGDVATSRVLVNAFAESDIDAVCKHKPAYVNFTANTLLTDIPFAPDRLIVEVLESVAPTPAVIEAIRRLRRCGFRIALDDYVRHDAEHPLMPYVDIVKIEYSRFSRKALIRTVAALKRANPEVVVLAEKIETRDDFEICRQARCDLFQGYFFARPEPVFGTPGPIRSNGVRRLLAALGAPGSTLGDAIPIIDSDQAQSRRVRRLSPDPLRRTRSLQAAAQALGLKRLRAFAILLALCTPKNKPYALRQIAAGGRLQWPTRYKLLSRSQQQAFIGRAVFVPDRSFGPTPQRRLTTNGGSPSHLARAPKSHAPARSRRA